MHSKRARFPPDVPTSKNARSGQASASTLAVGRNVEGLPEGMRGSGDTASATTRALGDAGGVPERTRGRRLGEGVESILNRGEKGVVDAETRDAELFFILLFVLFLLLSPITCDTHRNLASQH